MVMPMSSSRMQRALDKAERFIGRLSGLRRELADASLSEARQQAALVELESLVLVSRGSSETDHRQQLVLVGVADAYEAYLAPAAPQASAYAASTDRDALLAEAALRELRGEYPDDAARFPVEEVAASVRAWAERQAGGAAVTASPGSQAVVVNTGASR